jgi:hypothetical protein
LNPVWSLIAANTSHSTDVERNGIFPPGEIPDSVFDDTNHFIPQNFLESGIFFQ